MEFSMVKSFHHMMVNFMWKRPTIIFRRSRTTPFILLFTTPKMWLTRMLSKTPHDCLKNADWENCWRQYFPYRTDLFHQHRVYHTVSHYQSVKYKITRSYILHETYTQKVKKKHSDQHTFILWTSNFMFRCSIRPSNFVSL